MRLLAALVCATLMGSCGYGPPDAQRWVDNFVTRFDVPDCSDATLLRGGRNPDANKPGARWAFAAGDACFADIKGALEATGFKRIGASTYRYTGQSGWYELVELVPADEANGATIIWETIDP